MPIFANASIDLMLCILKFSCKIFKPWVHYFSTCVSNQFLISMMDKADGWLLIHNTPKGVGCRTKVEGCYGMVYEIWDIMHDAWNNCHKQLSFAWKLSWLKGREL
jgi:hypothetical protein